MVAERQQAVLEADPGAEGVGPLRRQARALLDQWGCGADLVEDVVLVLSELLGNAVLHAGTARRVTLARTGDVVRVEVEDDSPEVPAPNAYGPDAHTGRGLALVAALSTAWGVTRQADGKVVWSEVAGDGPTGPADEEVGSAPPAPAAPSGTLIRFLGIPVADYLALQQQNDAVQRDVDLLLIGSEEGLPAPLPEGLLVACRRLRDTFGGTRSSFRDVVVAAARRGQATVDVEMEFPPGSGPPGAEYVLLLEEIEGYAREGYLFIDPPGPAVIALRRWFVSEVRRQAAGEPARRAPGPSTGTDAPSDP